jgi:hypothetical protein
VSNVGILLLLSSDRDCVDISSTICGVFLLFHNIVVVEQLYKKRWMTTWESHAGSGGDGEYYCGRRGRMWRNKKKEQLELSFKQVMGRNVPAGCWSWVNRSGGVVAWRQEKLEGVVEEEGRGKFLGEVWHGKGQLASMHSGWELLCLLSLEPWHFSTFILASIL